MERRYGDYTASTACAENNHDACLGVIDHSHRCECWCHTKPHTFWQRLAKALAGRW